MKKTKLNATTQNFIEIADIHDDVVIFSNKTSCLVLEVTPTNFSLLGKEEQDGRIRSYSTFLNSLSFPVQIIIRSRKLDISSYLKLLENEENKTTNEKLKGQINKYRAFVSEMVKVNTVLDKKFYMVISYSSLEGNEKHEFAESSKIGLRSKAELLHSQLKRINIRAKTLRGEELTKLFFDFYNEGADERSSLA